VDNSLDVVVESSGAGTDSVLANITGYVLADNVEWLVIGTALSGTGNAIANTIVGNTGNELLVGNGGNDSLAGDNGNDKLQGADITTLGRSQIDTLTGGSGNDEFVLGASTGAFYNDGSASNAGAADYALITDFASGDSLVLQGSAANYYIAAQTVLGSGVGLYLETGATDELIAIIQNSGMTSTTANTVNTASFV
jgi:Ca2+-binding RTX toxin-like protein